MHTFFGCSFLSHTVGTGLEDCAETENLEFVDDCPSSNQGTDKRKQRATEVEGSPFVEEFMSGLSLSNTRLDGCVGERGVG
jgi:hypothetical protein